MTSFSHSKRRHLTGPATCVLIAASFILSNDVRAVDLRFSGCGLGMKSEIASAYELVLFRARTQRSKLVQCMDNAYLVEHQRKSPTKLVNDLLKPRVTKIRCKDLGGDSNANAHKVYRSAGTMNIDRDFVREQGRRGEDGRARLASVIAHELMHNAGYKHTGNPKGSTLYPNTVPEQMEACIIDLKPNSYDGIGRPIFLANEMVGYGLDGESNEMFAWSRNRYVTAGSSTRIHNFRHPRDFTVAPQTNVSRIVGMGLDGENNSVYAWLNTGFVISGSSENLDSKRAAYRYSLPPGYSPSDIVGMAVDGENNHNFVWFRNGFVSAGTSNDLDKFRSPYRYSLAPGYDPDDVTGMALDGENNMVFVYYNDNRVSAGTTNDLDKFRAAAQVLTGR